MNTTWITSMVFIQWFLTCLNVLNFQTSEENILFWLWIRPIVPWWNTMKPWIFACKEILNRSLLRKPWKFRSRQKYYLLQTTSYLGFGPMDSSKTPFKTLSIRMKLEKISCLTYGLKVNPMDPLEDQFLEWNFALPYKWQDKLGNYMINFATRKWPQFVRKTVRFPTLILAFLVSSHCRHLSF